MHLALAEATRWLSLYLKDLHTLCNGHTYYSVFPNITATFINLFDHGISFELEDAIFTFPVFFAPYFLCLRRIRTKHRYSETIIPVFSSDAAQAMVIASNCIFHLHWLKVASTFLAQVAICHHVMPHRIRQISSPLPVKKRFPTNGSKREIILEKVRTF